MESGDADGRGRDQKAERSGKAEASTGAAPLAMADERGQFSA